MKVIWLSLYIGLVVGVPAFAEDLSLDQFLREVQSQNLSLKAEEASFQAAREGSVGIALPPPMAGVTQMQDQTGKANGFEVSQTIPFPTKMSNDHSARKFEADAQSANRFARIREVLADAKLLYFKLWKAQERISLLQEKKSAIARHLKLAQAATRSDAFLKIHLVKAEGDMDLLENDLIQAEQDRREQQIRIAEFLNRDPKNFRPNAKAFTISEVPKVEELQTPNQIEEKKFELEALKAREREARSSWFPDLSLRYREMGGTQMTPRYSEIMVGSSLPFLYFWEPKALTGKTSAERMRGEYILAQEKRQIESKRETLFARAESLRRQLDQFRDKLLPRAEKRMRLIHNVAPRDMETLQDHRETMEALPDLKLKALDLREQYEDVVAELEKFASGGQQ
jgi:outer membrane protein TolC